MALNCGGNSNSTPVTITSGVITSEVNDNMLWTFDNTLVNIDLQKGVSVYNEANEKYLKISSSGIEVVDRTAGLTIRYASRSFSFYAIGPGIRNYLIFDRNSKVFKKEGIEPTNSTPPTASKMAIYKQIAKPDVEDSYNITLNKTATEDGDNTFNIDLFIKDDTTSTNSLTGTVTDVIPPEFQLTTEGEEGGETGAKYDFINTGGEKVSMAFPQPMVKVNPQIEADLYEANKNEIKTFDNLLENDLSLEKDNNYIYNLGDNNYTPSKIEIILTDKNGKPLELTDGSYTFDDDYTVTLNNNDVNFKSESIGNKEFYYKVRVTGSNEDEKMTIDSNVALVTVKVTDVENNPYFVTIRDLLLKSGSLNDELSEVEGIAYIDNKDNVKPEDMISTYEKDGSKDEVYLDKNQSIAFELKGDGEVLYVGAKAPSGKSTTLSIGKDDAKKDIDISSATDMYYEINPTTVGDKKYVIISNSGDNLLSLTKIKTESENVTYASSYDLLNYVGEKYDFSDGSENPGDGGNDTGWDKEAIKDMIENIIKTISDTIKDILSKFWK